MSQPLPIIERRRIEAELLKEVYATLVERYGKEDGAGSDLGIGSPLFHRQAAEFASNAEGGTSLQSFIDIQSNWTAENALEIEPLHRDETHYDFNVTRCRYAEMYKSMGLGEIGGLLSCNRDGSFCEGYDPKLKMTRTQTIMEGASHCDFRYRYEADARA